MLVSCASTDTKSEVAEREIENCGQQGALDKVDVLAKHFLEKLKTVEPSIKQYSWSKDKSDPPSMSNCQPSNEVVTEYFVYECSTGGAQGIIMKIDCNGRLVGFSTFSP